MDTGTSDKSGYEGLTPKQIKWYKSRSEQLKADNNSTPMVSLLCMHIPLPQAIDMYYSSGSAGNATKKVPGGLYKTFGILNERNPGVQNYRCENLTRVPQTYFHTTSPQNDAGMFDMIQKQGDIKAVITGHMHRTNVIGSYKGVLLGFSGKISTGCYCDELCRGGRVVRLNQSNPKEFTTSWIGSLDTSCDQPPIYSDGTVAVDNFFDKE